MCFEIEVEVRGGDIKVMNLVFKDMIRLNEGVNVGLKL